MTNDQTTLTNDEQKFYDWTLIDEGFGNDDDPDDNGGPTKGGITLEDFQRWMSPKTVGKTQLYALTKDQVKQIYHGLYWVPLNCAALPPPVAYTVFDCGLLHGVVRAGIWLQLAVGESTDGVIGPKTVKASGLRAPATIISAIADQRIRRAKNHADYWKFGRGWINRITRVKTRSLGMLEAAPSV